MKIYKIIILLIILLIYIIIGRLLNDNLQLYKISLDNLQKYKKHLDIDSKNKKNILCISSGGCNSFDFGLENVNNIYSIDYNTNQIFLCKFKLQCIKNLDYHDAFNILGRGYHDNIKYIYFKKIRNGLDRETQIYWDNNYLKFKKGFFIKHYYDIPIIRFKPLSNIITAA